MTIAQRLVRAGLVFVVFGTVASLVPTNGTAMATNAYPTTGPGAGNSYTFGRFTYDSSTTATVAAGSTVTLKVFKGAGGSGTNTEQLTNAFTLSTSGATNQFTVVNNLDGTITVTPDPKGSSGKVITITVAFTAGPSIQYVVTVP